MWPAALLDSEVMETVLTSGSEAQVTVGLETKLN